MKRSAPLLLVVWIIATAGCSSLTVMFDYDQQEDFSKYHSFDFLPLPQDIKQATSDLVIKRIIAATTRHMQAKGFEFTTNSPDLLIAIHTEAKDKFNVTNWGYHYAPYDIYWRGHGYWYGSGIDVQQYEEGTLILDLVRADENEMIWRGAASRALPLNPSPDKLDKIVNEAVAKILENFPPTKE